MCRFGGSSNNLIDMVFTGLASDPNSPVIATYKQRAHFLHLPQGDM